MKIIMKNLRFFKYSRRCIIFEPNLFIIILIILLNLFINYFIYFIIINKLNKVLTFIYILYIIATDLKLFKNY